MRFAFTQKVITFALAAVAAFPMLTSGEVGLGFSLTFPVMWIAGWFLETPLTRRARYRRLVTGAIIVMLVVQLGRMAAGQPMAMMGMEFASVLLGVKLMSRGYAADYYQIVVLSFLHIIAATVAMDDLYYGLCFVFLVALSPPVLALTYLRQEMERRFGPSAHADGSEMLERLLRSKRIISPGFLLGSSLLSLPVLLVTAILFITFPRLGLGFLGRLPNNKAEVGFGDEVMLGDLDIVRLEDTVLIRMTPLGEHGSLPEHLSLRLRGAVFDRYEKDTWTCSRNRRWRRIRERGKEYLLDPSIALKVYPGFEVMLESMEPKLLFVPEGTGRISTAPVAKRGIDRPRVLEKSQFGTIRYKDDAQVGIRYRVDLTGSAPSGDPPGAGLDYLQLPEGSERLRRLAQSMAPEDSARDKASSLLRGLKRGYQYSIKLASDERNLEADTPLDRFLFARKTGTCEHFATALTLMLRAVGIPARLVTGFFGADWNSIGRYYVVRKRFAHSWTEAYLDGRWMTLDATPPSGEVTGQARASTLAMFLDTLRMRWHQNVVGYDMGTQKDMAVGLWRLWARRYGMRGSSPEIPRFVPVTAALLVIGVGVVYWWRRRPARTGGKGRSRRTRRRHAEATRLFLALERRLARLGYPRPPTRTPDEHVRAVIASADFETDAAAQVTTRYNQVRFGRGAFGEGEVDRLISMVRSLGRT